MQFLNDILPGAQKSGLLKADHDGGLAKIPSDGFGEFNASGGYGTWIPSAVSLNRSFMSCEPKMLEEAARNIGSVGGEVLAGDLSFAMMKCIRSKGSGGGPKWTAYMDFINEYGQVLYAV